MSVKTLPSKLSHCLVNPILSPKDERIIYKIDMLFKFSDDRKILPF